MQQDNVIFLYLIKYKQALFDYCLSNLSRLGGQHVQRCCKQRDKTKGDDETHSKFITLKSYNMI